jgi:peptidoglycan hydrolase-like protein with peptidoglycan-binding domain
MNPDMKISRALVAACVLVPAAAVAAPASAAVTPSAASVSTYCPDPPANLVPGDVSSCVANLQAALNGTYGFNLSVDGQYGPLTTAAVKAYQTKYGLSVDGQFGPHSRAAFSGLTALDNDPNGHQCVATLKPVPFYGGSGYGDWGVGVWFEASDPAIDCLDQLQQDVNGTWTTVEGTYDVKWQGSVTTKPITDNAGTSMRACVLMVAPYGFGPSACTPTF